MLQGRFKIISQPSRLWMFGEMKIYIEACIIMHNMIIEDEKDEVGEDLTIPFNLDYVLDEDRMEDDNIEMIRNSNSPIPGTLAYMLSKMRQVSNKNDHYKLRNDIIEHLY
jgi:DNA polymerase III sliding clamp (beta) subunit (PCNA family)